MESTRERFTAIMYAQHRGKRQREVVGVESGLRGAPCVGLEVRAANSELLDEAKSKLQRHVSMTYLVLPRYVLYHFAQLGSYYQNLHLRIKELSGAISNIFEGFLL